MSLNDTTHTTQTPATPARASRPAKPKTRHASTIKAIPPHRLTAEEKSDIAYGLKALREYESGKVKYIPWEEVKKDLGL